MSKQGLTNNATSHSGHLTHTSSNSLPGKGQCLLCVWSCLLEGLVFLVMSFEVDVLPVSCLISLSHISLNDQ